MNMIAKTTIDGRTKRKTLAVMRKFLPTLFVYSGLVTLGFGSPHEDIQKQLDEAINILRAGKPVPAEVQKKCFDSFSAYSKGQFEKHQVDRNTNFPEPDRMDFYVNAVRAGLLLPNSHGGWATADQHGQR